MGRSFVILLKHIGWKIHVGVGVLTVTLEAHLDDKPTKTKHPLLQQRETTD